MLYGGFAYDDHGGNMNTWDLTTILSGMAAAAGQRIDILGFDACLMSHVEIGYQVRNYVDFLVASEETEPAQGWDYQGWLRTVTSASTPFQVASSIVDTYGRSYQPGLVIYFPENFYTYKAWYDDPARIAFANEGWRDFLKAFMAR